MNIDDAYSYHKISFFRYRISFWKFINKDNVPELFNPKDKDIIEFDFHPFLFRFTFYPLQYWKCERREIWFIDTRYAKGLEILLPSCILKFIVFKKEIN
jgi:hypothetical protein